MKTKEQMLKPGWWMQSKGYRTYALREFSGVLIAVWAIHHLMILIISNPATRFYTTPFLKTGMIIDIIGLLGATIHSITWLRVMPKILPVRLTEKGELMVFVVLICMVIGLNSAILLL